MTAAKDNETLDHLLSVVNDEHTVRDLHRIAKLQDGRSRGRELWTAKRLLMATSATGSKLRPDGVETTSSHRRANLPRYEFGIAIAEHF
jgi:hypothetical protein